MQIAKAVTVHTITEDGNNGDIWEEYIVDENGVEKADLVESDNNDGF